MPRNRASSDSESIRVIAICGPNRYGRLIFVDVLLYLSRHQKRLLSEREPGSYGSIRLCIVGWCHPLGEAKSHRVGLMGQSAMSIRLSTGKNGFSRLWEVMGILSLRCDSESTDTVGRLVVCTQAASCQCRTMKDVIYTLATTANCLLNLLFLSPAEVKVKVVGLPFTIFAAHVNCYVVLGMQ